MPEIDIGAELLLEIEKRYERGIMENKLLRDIAAKINLGRGTFDRARIYAREAGRELSRAFQSVLVPEALPNGRIYWNIAETAIKPHLEAVGLEVRLDRCLCYVPVDPAVRQGLRNEDGLKSP